MVNVLYVEDDESLKGLVKRYFGKEGIDVIDADKPMDLGSHLESEVEVIVSDGNIYNYDVYDTMRVRDALMPNTPIVLFSGNGDLVDKLKSMGYDAIQKPDLKGLVDIVKNYTFNV